MQQTDLWPGKFAHRSIFAVCMKLKRHDPCDGYSNIVRGAVLLAAEIRNEMAVRCLS